MKSEDDLEFELQFWDTSCGWRPIKRGVTFKTLKDVNEYILDNILNLAWEPGSYYSQGLQVPKLRVSNKWQGIDIVKSDNVEQVKGESVSKLKYQVLKREEIISELEAKNIALNNKLSRRINDQSTEMLKLKEELRIIKNSVTPLRDSVNRLTSERSKMLRKVKRQGIKL